MSPRPLPPASSDGGGNDGAGGSGSRTSSSPNSLQAQWSYDNNNNGGGGKGGSSVGMHSQHTIKAANNSSGWNRLGGSSSNKNSNSSSGNGQRVTPHNLQALQLSRNISSASASSVDPPPIIPGSHYHTNQQSQQGGGVGGLGFGLGPSPLLFSATNHPHANPNPNYQQSNFRACLRGVQVSSTLQSHGIQCIRVHANGTTDNCWLTLSKDKFTLYLSSQPLYEKPSAAPKKSGWLFGRGSGSTQPTKPILARSVSDASGSTTGSSSHHQATTTTSSNNKNRKQAIRAIDIGAITRIQRGYTNRRFFEQQSLK